MSALDIMQLSKRYHGASQFALKDLSIKVEPGEIYGFLGANGAGKSTTIRTLLNFIQPTSGTAQILGQDIVKDSVAVKRHVGYLSGEVALYKKMTGQHFLDYMASLQPVKHPEYLMHLQKAFQSQLAQPLGELSKGNRQKIGLIQALMHEPDVLILDEPTSGLDPLMQEVFFAEMEAAKGRGAAVFVSSHNLSEVQRMCDRVGFIRSGELVAEQFIAELSATASQTFDVTFADKVPAEALRKIKGAEVQPLAQRQVRIHIRGELSPLFTVLSRSQVVRLDKPSISLEDEFLRFYDQQGAAK